MKATVVLIAGNEAENYGRKLMFDAHKAGNVGFEMRDPIFATRS